MGINRKNHTEYEFSKETMLLALKDAWFKCDKCGKPKKECRDGYLEGHHRIFVAFAIAHDIPAWVVSNVYNCQILCKDCHLEVHREQKSPPPEVITWVCNRAGLRVRANV